ncbi:hypothetical protein BO79DRAFT_220089 [Aspergillus costaricaensis CBS 115574]|uniref:Uncharacterized protein n=1 Tax=Aspergillus costaricaensis CBS 115574 TaxID=1448317 RepID=A0ACD1I734_9EURO|nr:hypothetical protein BO79DRAFT_220089 [Aspergillus costaricaensis CBS 115574]RAK86076.1 hypothetical protein BO79DRAFT_220089 [Aspergillus costaricaensis CBS 115574]
MTTSRSKPTFALIDRLPAEHHASVFLGRIVSDIFHPLHEYCPEDPRAALQHTPIDVADTSVSAILTASHSAALRAKLEGIFGLTKSQSSSTGKQIAGDMVITRSLPQHRKSFVAVVGAHLDEIIKLLENNGGKGYMVVGLKTCRDAEIGTSRTSKRKSDVEVSVPAGQIASIASHGAVDPALVPNPTVGWSREVSADWLGRNTAEGEQIFALQYREIGLKKHFFSSKPSTARYKMLKMVDWGEGVYGESEEGREVVYEDDESDEEGDQDEDADVLLKQLVSGARPGGETSELWLTE